jgi:ribonuclease Z
MSERKLYILGTAAQVPTRSRNHCGYFIKWDKEGFLFDPGEGTQKQIILSGISASKITKIFITHFHGDHCLGLPGVIQRIALDGVTHSIGVYYPASGQKYLEHIKDICAYHNSANLIEHPISKEGLIFENEKFNIIAKSLDHIIDTYGYRIQEKNSYTLLPEKLSKIGLQGKAIGKLKSEGKIKINEETIYLDDVGVKKNGQSFAFVMDTRLCPNAYKLAENVDILVCESTYLSTEKEEAKNFAHLTALQAATIAKESQVKKLVLSHFSQRYPFNSDFIEEASSIFKNVIAPAAGEVIKFPKQKREINKE